MRGFQNFFLGIFLSLGLITLAAGGISFLGGTQGDLSDQALAASCPKVGDQDNRNCDTTCDGKAVKGTEVFECQSNLEWFSDGRCYAAECTNTSGAVPATTPSKPGSTTPNQTSENSGESCQQSDVFLVGKVIDLFNGLCLSELIEGIIGNMFSTLGTAIGGDSTTQVSGKPQTMAEAYERYGAMGGMGMLVQEMYDSPPFTTSDYLATIKPIAPAFAQTPSGNKSLQGVEFFWTASRNLAYIAFILILVGVGLMIMFRAKLDPRTTVTVTAALPNLVVSLILITFSFAFAALMIDFGKVIEEVVKRVLLGAVTRDPLIDVDSFPNGVGLSIGDIWGSFVFDNKNALNIGGNNISAAFFHLVLLAFGFFIGFQVFIMLVFRYVSLLVKPVLAPFTFLMSAFPGKGNAASNWFKSYAVDVLTFPIVLFIINLAIAIKTNTDQIGANGDPFGIFGTGTALNSLLAIAVLMMATKVPAFLEEALDVKPASHVERAGSQSESLAKKIPIVKNIL